MTAPSSGINPSGNVLDEAWMAHALRLAEQGRMSAPPNPWVWCVLVKDDAVIGEGWHHRAGDLHAEAQALRDVLHRAGSEESARVLLEGSTAYVTLEPCAHTGRQPPCDQALIRAKVARVVVAVTDPDSRVSLRGIQNLRDAQIQVDVGVMREAVAASLRPYLHHRSTGLPWVVLKVATSIDGKIACGDGSSKWITSSQARLDAQLLRARSQAVIVGSGTAVADNPALTVRVDQPSVTELDYAMASEPRGGPLLRVVLDARGRVVSGQVFEPVPHVKTVVFTTTLCPRESLDAWEARAADVVVVAQGEHQGVNLHEVLTTLGQRGVMQVMVEGGASLHAAFFKAQLVQEMWVYHGPLLLGSGSVSWPAGSLVDTIAHARHWTLVDVVSLGSDVRCRYLAPQ